MPLQTARSWRNEELDALRDSAIRFIETEMQPQDDAARKRGHVGHAIWRRAGELGFLCADIPEAHSRLTVSPGTEGGKPASNSAIRATFRLSSPA